VTGVREKEVAGFTSAVVQFVGHANTLGLADCILEQEAAKSLADVAVLRTFFVPLPWIHSIPFSDVSMVCAVEACFELLPFVDVVMSVFERCGAARVIVETTCWTSLMLPLQPS